MSCQRCNSERIAQVGAKCSDCCGMWYKNKEHSGYVPSDFGIGGGDYVELYFCLECGQIQGVFPLPEPDLEDHEEWTSLEEEKGWQRYDIVEVRNAKSIAKDMLLSIKQVVGIGVIYDRKTDSYSLKINLSNILPPGVEIPEEINGVPTVVEAVGNIVPRS